MATVYLADDVRHQRKVATKVLRTEAQVGAARLPARLNRETFDGIRRRGANVTRMSSVFLAFIVTACVSHTGGGPASAVRSWDIDAPFDAVWDATLTALSDTGFEVKEALRASGTIETVPQMVGEGSEFADCESPYWVRLRLTIGEGVTGTRLEIDPSFTAREDPRSEACSTTGELERALSRRVIEETR